MNSPYRGFDCFSDWSWGGGDWNNTPPTDGDHAFDSNTFPTSSADSAPLPWQPPASWLQVAPSAALDALGSQQFDFNQEHQDRSFSNAASLPPLPNGGNQGLPYRNRTCAPQDGSTSTPTSPLHGLGISTDDTCMYPRDGDEQLVAPHIVQAIFPRPSETRKDPAQLFDENGQPLEKRSPRFEGDLYTPLWIRGEGANRAAFCGFCDTWHKLKDSAYWYHLHYSHGIACSTGRPLDPPREIRQSSMNNGWEALCGTCRDWITIGKGAKRQTTYWRHAYKCSIKAKAEVGP